MFGDSVQPVLRCGRCNKPFDKQSTLKRHGYHCRSRPPGIAVRARSCLSCAKAKLRCDNKRPKCSRCTTKITECLYPTPKTTSSRVQQEDCAPAEIHPTEPSLTLEASDVLYPPLNNGNESIPDSALADLGLDFTDIEAGYLDWPDSNLPQIPTWDLQVDENSCKLASLYPHSKPTSDRAVSTPQTGSLFDIAIPRSFTYYPRSFIYRSNANTGRQKIAGFMTHTLKSYLVTMLRDDGPPPFIHPDSVSDVDNCDMESLSNCFTLMPMLRSRAEGSRKLFWKNVRMECERVFEEHSTMNKWQLLASLQALFIYILIRLSDGETAYNNYDHLLLATLALLSKQIVCKDVTCNSEFCHYGSEIDWKDWIFEESRRRLGVVYRVINMLVYLDVDNPQCELRDGIVLAPLPAQKQLWEAVNEDSWKMESNRSTGFKTGFALARNGDLVQLYQGPVHCSDAVLLTKSSGSVLSRSRANWEDWCSGMDGLGGLVMLAASFVA